MKLTWIKNHWWKLLLIPIVFVFIYFVLKLVIVYISSNIGIPDLSDLDKSFYEDQQKMDKSEQAVLDMIRKERDQLWLSIDQGNPTPAEIFDGEITNG